MNEIYEYKYSNNIVSKNNGILWRALIQVKDGSGKLLHNEQKEFSFSTNKYGNEEVVILWELTEYAMKKLKLRGNYTPFYQDFSFDKDILIIRDGEMQILIYPLIR